MSNSEKGNQQRRSQDHNNRGAPRPQQLNNNLSTANGTQRGGGSSRDNQPSNNRSERGGNGGRQGKAGSSSSSSVWAHTSPSSSSASASASIATSTPNNTPNPTNSTGGITIAKRNVTDILKNAFTSPSSGTASKDSSSTEAVKIHASRDLEVYGVILSIRGSFGFIQAIFEDEQFYYSDREFYDNMKVGDRVAFLPRTSPKGPSAQNVRFLIPTLSKIVGQFSGVITRSPERHRSGCGLIEIDVTTLTSVGQDVKQVLEQKFKKTISFRPVDIATASIPKNHFLDKGDGVEFSIAKMHDSNLYLATEVKFKQLKRDRLISMQIQRMLEAGAVREVGVVTTLKNKEYGFIRAQDRKDELYFRMDDIADENQEIEEGMEVDFFVIAEVIKGKVCDRAIHLQKIAKGTVQFEVIVSSETLVTVEDEPGGGGANEAPGIATLPIPLDVSSASSTGDLSTIDRVDIWQRCLPDDMICKRGDVLSINVHYYRPEKLFFARSVRMHEYLPYGRDRGVVIAIKEQAFGFINSLSRKVDLYFKTTQVMNDDGTAMLDASKIRLGMIVSYDIIQEDSRLRAARVKIEETDIPRSLLEASEEDDMEEGEVKHPYCISANMIGVVVRSALKKDAIGLIEIESNAWKTVYENDFIDPMCVQEVQSFLSNPKVSSYDLLALNASLLKSYMDVLLKYKTYLKVDLSAVPQMEQARNLRISKTPELLALGNKVDLKSLQTQSGVDTKRNEVAKPKDGFCIPYLRDDVHPSEGMIGNDLEVTFDVHWDRSRGKRMAKNIRLTDEVIPNEIERQSGVVDVIVDKGEKFGFIRVTATEEKLLWSSSSAKTKANLDVGSFVTFQIRRRGGMRMACDIVVVPAVEMKQREVEVREELCKAVIVSATHAVLVDTLSCPPVQHLYVHPPVINEIIVPAAKEGKSWEKVKSGATSTGIEEVNSPPSNVEVNHHEAEDASSLALTKEDTAAAASGARREYKAKYYSSTQRALIPIKLNADIKVEVGDVVSCRVALSYKQRHPVHIVVVEVLAEKATKKKGTVNRVKFRPRNLPKASTLVNIDQFNKYNLANTDFIEILDVEAMTKSETTLNRTEVHFFYCDVHEIPQPLNEYKRDILTQSDEIEFWHLPSVGYVALAPSVVPKARMKGEEGLKFHGLGFNEQLKEMKSKTGVTNTIVMAKGPPTDTAQGFEAGWRQVDSSFVASLPWASLLTHLK